MKKIGAALISSVALLSLFTASSATAAPKPVLVKKLERIATGLTAE